MHITPTLQKRDEMRQNQRIIYALSCRNGKRERESEKERGSEGKGEREERKKKEEEFSNGFCTKRGDICIYMRESSYPDLNFNSAPYPNSSLGRSPDYARNSTSLICAILRIISVIQ